MRKRMKNTKGGRERSGEANVKATTRGDITKNGEDARFNRVRWLGTESDKEGQRAGTIAELTQSVSLNPHGKETYLQLGRCYEKLKNYGKAVSFYEKALELDPACNVARYSLAVALQLWGLPREAEKEYLKVLECDENHVMARNNLAAVYLNEGKRHEAIKELKRVAEIDPHNMNVRDNLTAASGAREPRSIGKKSCKAGISLCVVMRDEGDEVRDFFRLASPWVDEIIVADTRPAGMESHPAAEFGAQVIRPSWEESFSTLRNISLRHARFEWILVLDADEYISKEGFSYLRALINNQDFDGFRFIQRNYRDCPSQSGWVPCTDRVKQAWNSSGWITSYPVKLFKNREEIFFENLIGESVEKSVHRSGGKIGRATLLIHHFDQGCDPLKNSTKEKSLLKLLETTLF